MIAKAYGDFLSRALNIEYSSKGIIMQAVLTGQVITNMSANVPKTVMSVTAKSYVSHALKTVGIESRTFGHWNHKIQAFFMENVLIPILGQKFSNLMFSSTQEVRRNYYVKN